MLYPEGEKKSDTKKMELEIKQIKKKLPILLSEASVITIQSKEISLFLLSLQGNEFFEIPGHLKRARKIDKDFSNILLKMGKHPGFETVMVPSSNDFENKEEFTHYNRIWPVSWYPHKEVSLDLDYIYKFSSQILEKYSKNEDFDCASRCFIVDPENKKIMSENSSIDRIFHPILELISITSKKNASIGVNYLCTGMDVFLSREPCQSCAMALIHGRIRRVFYYKSMTGVFEKKFFHEIKSFNHRFQVFRFCIK